MSADDNATTITPVHPISFVKSSDAHVVLSATLDSADAQIGDRVVSSIINEMAVCGVFVGTENVRPGSKARIVTSNLMRFGPFSGQSVLSETDAIRIGETSIIWKTRVYCGQAPSDGQLIAELSSVVAIEGTRELERQQAESLPPQLAEARQDAADQPTEDPRDQSTADIRRRQIMEGASLVIMEKGFDRASVREIAQRSGMPVPTMYKYVRSKDEVLVMIYKEIFREIGEMMVVDQSSLPYPKERLISAIRNIVATYGKYNKQLKLTFRETSSLNYNDKREVYSLDMDFVKNWKKIIVDLGADRKLDVDPELLANIVYHIPSAWVLRHWALGRWSQGEVITALEKLLTAALVSPQR